MAAELPPPPYAAHRYHLSRSGDRWVLTVTADLQDQPCATDLVLVVDRSGSMGLVAAPPGAPGEEASSMTRLQLAQHAILTTATALFSPKTLPSSRIALVEFSDAAYVPLHFTEYLSQVTSATHQLAADGRTNLWGGITTALQLLQHREDRSRRGVIMVLTDGEPNLNHPPGGYGPALARAFAPLAGAPPSNPDLALYVFGFGYALESTILSDLATAGRGAFAFIPDAGLLGSVFGHALSHIRTTEGLLSIEFDVPVPLASGDTVSSAHLGPLCFGQDRHLAFSLPYRDGLQSLGRIPLRTIRILLDGRVIDTVDMSAPLSVGADPVILRRFDQTAAVRTVLREHHLPAFDVGDPAFQRDLDGEITLALAEPAFSRWGRHFLLSWARAHDLEFCNNFKDPGVQNYGGSLFRQLRDQVDTVFLSIPPPVAHVDMSSYHGQGNPCFTAHTMVTLADGTLRRCDQLIAGDLVRTLNGSSARILTVVVTPHRSTWIYALPRNVTDALPRACPDALPLPTLPHQVPCPEDAKDTPSRDILHHRAYVTAYHPVFWKNEWVFPGQQDEAEPCIMLTDLYSFVLDRDHIIDLDGLPAITLGHGFTEGILTHPYLGTQRVLDDLRATLPAGSNGLPGRVTVKNTRRGPDGLICGFEWE